MRAAVVTRVVNDCAPALLHDETCSFSPHMTRLSDCHDSSKPKPHRCCPTANTHSLPLSVSQSYALYVIGDEDATSTNMLKYLSRLSAGGLCVCVRLEAIEGVFTIKQVH